MAILITGASGQLGSELCARLGRCAAGLGADRLDVTDSAAVTARCESEPPDAVINCAAYTAVDRAEHDVNRCFAVNAEAVATLAATCRRLDIPLVHVSSDYVFGGDRGRMQPYVEDDAPAPLSVYGASKLAGERNAATWRRHIIVRTCGLYTAARPQQPVWNFAQTMLRLARERDVIRVVDDQICSPTYVPNLAAAVQFLMEREAYGTYHVVDRGATSWCGFAAELFRQAGLPTRVEPISTEEFVAERVRSGGSVAPIAPRPAYSVLDARKYERLGGPPMMAWQEGIAAFGAAGGGG